MAAHPPITFRGALEILGHYERPWLDKVNALAGGIILGSGLAPAAAAISSVWGWVDQKNEGVGLLRTALDSAAKRLTDTGGLERHQLVIAAHTALVMSAFFDAVAESPLGELVADAAVADRYKLMLAGATDEDADSTVRALYKVAVPAPTAVVGFHANVGLVRLWAARMYAKTIDFVRNVIDESIDTSKWLSYSQEATSINAAVAEKYKSYYLEYSARVPEFAIWANTLEHAATRSAMGSLEQLLSHVVGSTRIRDMRATMQEVNIGVLREPILDVHTDGYGFDTPFPSVESLFVKPHCRAVTSGQATRISSEDWWKLREPAGDLCLVLARHFTSVDATTTPLLLLGHPGAGKSLVTKMIAARMPAPQYTVVRVSLRHVDANASLPDQVQQALDQSTHGRVQWADLVDQSTDVTRVLLLDGLDELLQASTSDRTDYLVRIAEFQRREADMGFPLAVVVTSRTLVADRVTVPRNTPVIKLEEFDDDQVSEWVRNWNDANTSEQLPEMSAQWALTHRHLAAQPLLLLMLTLYRAHRRSDAADELSSADLYGRLFDDYARREISKREGRPLQGTALEEAVDRQLRTLAVAALGMFNRGRQDITESDLSEDLKTLEKYTSSGQRLLAEFFFIHSPEADDIRTVRSYEFLHATFAEYLVAERVVDVLRDVAEGAFGRRVQHDPEDDLLFAVLSHQPLAVQQPVIEFVNEKLSTLSTIELERIRRTIDVLLTGYRGRRPSRHFADYHPTPPDGLRSMATYSANLVLLRIQRPLAGAGARLEELFSTADPLPMWRATVDLWKSSLDESGYHAMLGAVDLVDGGIAAPRGLSGFVPELQTLHHARLLHDRDTLSTLRHGAAVTRSISYLVLRGSEESRAWEWYDYMSAWLRAATASARGDLPRLAMAPMPPEMSVEQQMEITSLVLQASKGSDYSPHSGWNETMLWFAGQLSQFGNEIRKEIAQQRARQKEIWRRLDELRAYLPARSADSTERSPANRVLEMLQSPPSESDDKHFTLRPFKNVYASLIERNQVYHCVAVDDSGDEVQAVLIDERNANLGGSLDEFIRYPDTLPEPNSATLRLLNEAIDPATPSGDRSGTESEAD